MTPKLVTQDFKLWFGEKQVLTGISIEIPKQTIVALMGPSGCGKSTLLRSMNRMHDFHPDARMEGHILLDGQDIYEKNVDAVAIRQRIGMVFQQPNPFPKSIFDNVAYGLYLNGKPDARSVAETVEQSLRESFLWDEVKDSLHHSALALSGGQQQRLCIARAVAVRPEVILMDEPCSALDPISTAKIEELMLSLKANYTLIVVTHNLQQARRVADYTGMMYLGQLIEYGSTPQLFEEPQQPITRNYVHGAFG